MNFSIKSNKLLQFLLILFLNILFFSLSAYFLPISFETNDDLAMCLISSGAYTGIPEARLVFIHYFYGLVLAFFYKAFKGIEWYTVSFCIIHIISLSIIIFSFINSNKIKSAKFISIILLYVLELTNIQSLQFTSTAGIAAFAGILLLFERKKVFVICGLVLFFIATFVRFHSAMVVLLLMLPFFIYKVYPDIRKHLKILIPVVISIFGAFLLQIIDKQAYNVENWSYYREYNEVRGYILGNPNRLLIIDNIPPSVISQGDYWLFLNHFIDNEYVDLARLREIRELIADISIMAKLRNIIPFLGTYKWTLSIILVSSIIFFVSTENKKKKIFIPLFLIYLSIVLLYTSLDGIISKRVFMALFFPIVYFIYINDSIFSKKVMRVIYIIIIAFLNINFLSNIYQIKKYNKYMEVFIGEQNAVIERIKGKNTRIFNFCIDLQIEKLCSPFHVREYFSDFSLVGTGWFTNIPYSNRYKNLYLTLLEAETYLFVAKPNVIAANLIQDALFIHYNRDSRLKVALQSTNYLLIKFEEGIAENETQS